MRCQIVLHRGNCSLFLYFDPQKNEMTTKVAGDAAKELETFQLTNSSTSDESFPSDDELDFLNERYKYSDELPKFDIRSISPTGRSPSPIDRTTLLSDSMSEMCLSPSDSQTDDEGDFSDLVPLKEINAKINSPAHRSNQSLETIFEGVFLETPPKKTNSWRVDLAKVVVRNSLNCLEVENVQKPVQDSKRKRRSLSVGKDMF